MSKALKKLIDINRLREFKNKLVGAGSAYVQTSAVDQTIAGTKTFSKPIVGSVTGNAATATKATQDAAGNTITTTYATKAHTHTKSQITDFPALATVATSGSYTDLANKPAIPTVNNATLTIQKNGTTVKTFTANASANVTANITVPTKVSDLTNDSGYITSSGSCNYANSAGSAPANGGTSTASAYLNGYGTLQYGVDRLQYFNINTTTTSGASVIANPTQDWYYHIIQSHPNSYGYYFDIASHFHSNSVYYRRIASGQESGWIQFIDSGNIGSQSVNFANSAGYANWLRTSSHSDHLFHTEWDGGYFWTYVTAGDGGYRPVRVARSDSAAYADNAGNGVDSSGNGWIRFRNGIQICWAKIPCGTSGSSTWTYGASFSSRPVVTVCDQGADSKSIYLTRAADIRTTSCLIVMVDKSGSSYMPGEAQCIAIGKWK